MPYTYLIIEKSTGKRYYGLRYRKGCQPSGLGVVYFSSSKVLQPLCKTHPENYMFEVRRSFATIEAAREWEHKVLRRMRVKDDPRWYNQTDNKLFSLESCLNGAHKGMLHTDESKRKMSEAHKQHLADPKNHSMFGKHHSDESKRKMRDAKLGKHASEDTRLKMSNRRSGANHPLFGKHHSTESKLKMRMSHIGMHASEETRRKMVDSHKRNAVAA